MPDFASQRPSPENRRFTSPAVEEFIAEVSAKMGDAELAWLFSNCFPHALDTPLTVAQPAEGAPDTSVSHGDPDAIDLGDSTQRLWPYLSLAKADPALRSFIAGTITHEAAIIRLGSLDPHGCAFSADPVRKPEEGSGCAGENQCGDFQRTYRPEQLCSFLRLTVGFWKATGDTSWFDPGWESAVAFILETLAAGQAGLGEGSGVSIARESSGDTSFIPAKRSGLTRSALRPSGAPSLFPFVVPANAMAVACLNQIADMLRQLKVALPLAQKADALAAAILDALGLHAILPHPAHHEILAYELDGLGSHSFMDEAALPSLLSLPYFGCCPKNDLLYQQTRSYILSHENPWYAEGSAGRGVGGAHLGQGWISPVSIIMQALTSDLDEEIATCLGILKATHSESGFIPEAFWKNDRAKFTRPFCAQASGLYGELILTLYRERPHILEATFSRCGS